MAISITTRQYELHRVSSPLELNKDIAELLNNGYTIIHYNTFNRTDRQGEGYADKHYTVHVIVFQRGVPDES